MTTATTPVPALVIREGAGGAYYEAKFRWAGQQVKRRIGPAWVERGPDGWQKKTGRAPAGYLDPRSAPHAAAELAAAYIRDATETERVERERRTAGVTFRELAHAYLQWAETVGGRKPSTMAQHRLDLAEPGIPHKRGSGQTAGLIMAALGDRPAAQIEPKEIEAVLLRIAERGVTNRTVNRYRAVLSAIFSFGMKPTTYDLPSNPAARTDKRRQPSSGTLIYFTPEEIETAAEAMAAGLHRKFGHSRGPYEAFEDAQDAEAVRIAAYAGLRLGELLALKWRNVDFAGSALTIDTALSDGVESTPKSGRFRRVPLAGQAADALRRLRAREDFTHPDDYVICNAYGRHLNGSALRRRYKLARDAAGLRPLRWHDLRHTFGSLLVAGGVDLLTVKDAMGHVEITTTQRYLHARPATETAERFTQAFRR